MSQEIKDRFKQFVVPTYGRFPITLDRGKAAYVWDTDDKRYLDLGGGTSEGEERFCSPAPGICACAIQ